MRTSRLIMALLVALPVGLWLLGGHASLARTLAAVAGAALVASGWIRLTAARRPAPGFTWTVQPPARCCCADRRFAAAPRRRPRRDVRCPAPRATAPARRPTRR
jgi:hypothetical protein